RQPGSAGDVIERRQLAGAEYHLQVRAAAGLAHGPDLLVDLAVAPGQEGAPVDHHVNLVGPGAERVGRRAPLAPRRPGQGRRTRRPPAGPADPAGQAAGPWRTLP